MFWGLFSVLLCRCFVFLLAAFWFSLLQLNFPVGFDNMALALNIFSLVLTNKDHSQHDFYLLVTDHYNRLLSFCLLQGIHRFMNVDLEVNYNLQKNSLKQIVEQKCQKED
jgi:hypothetical protein